MKRKAFTLIELLVVIAIISLLVSILLPSLQKAKSLARQVVCLTRLKSIGSALAIYQGEFDGRGPIGFTYQGWRDGFSFWKPGENDYRMYHGWYMNQDIDLYGNPCWALGPYLERKGGNVVEDGGVSVSPVACPNAEGYGEAHQAGYAVNGFLGFETLLGTNIGMPATSPMLMDGWGPIPNSFNYFAYPSFLFGWDSCKTYFPIISKYAHDGGANYLFFDSHAENHRPPDMSDDELDGYFRDLWTWQG